MLVMVAGVMSCEFGRMEKDCGTIYVEGRVGVSRRR